MARSSYQTIMQGIFRHEGGKVNHQKDPGGKTNMGITQRTLDAARRQYPSLKLPMDVFDLTQAQAAEIYRLNYWNPIKGDDIPAGIDYVTMDSGVNSGPKRGVQWSQRAVGVTADGVVGPQTLSAWRSSTSSVVITRQCDIRRGFLRGLSTFATFGKGWTRRVAEVEAGALKLAKADLQAAANQAHTRSQTEAKQAAGTGAGAAAGGSGASVADLPDLGALPEWALPVIIVVVLGVVAINYLGRSRIDKERAEVLQEAANETGT